MNSISMPQRTFAGMFIAIMYGILIFLGGMHFYRMQTMETMHDCPFSETNHALCFALAEMNPFVSSDIVSFYTLLLLIAVFTGIIALKKIDTTRIGLLHNYFKRIFPPVHLVLLFRKGILNPKSP